jgi:hypothetical protein
VHQDADTALLRDTPSQAFFPGSHARNSRAVSVIRARARCRRRSGRLACCRVRTTAHQEPAAGDRLSSEAWDTSGSTCPGVRFAQSRTNKISMRERLRILTHCGSTYQEGGWRVAPGLAAVPNSVSAWAVLESASGDLDSRRSRARTAEWTGSCGYDRIWQVLRLRGDVGMTKRIAKRRIKRRERILRMAHLTWFSHLDEDHFFAWLQEIPAVKRVTGLPAGIEVLVKEPIDKASLYDLIVLMTRYGLDRKCLRPLCESHKDRRWFTDPKTYWHKAVFGG